MAATLSPALLRPRPGVRIRLRHAVEVTKLRIGFAIALTAVAGLAIAPAPLPSVLDIAQLVVAILLASGAAGAFNHYAERDLDARMARTRARPFASGEYRAGTGWLLAIAVLLLAGVGLAARLNSWVALHTFLGAFFYGVVYTIWLKRKTSLNIVIGGLSGSFAVLAGAAVVHAAAAPAPLILAMVLFLWTPPHFWSLAYLYRDEYRAAGVPMLPALVSDARVAQVVAAHVIALSALSVAPAWYGAGAAYLICAALGGLLFVFRAMAFVREPSRATARATFFASLIQLSLLIAGTLFARLD